MDFEEILDKNKFKNHKVKEKKINILTIVFMILTIVFLISTIVFATLYFTKDNDTTATSEIEEEPITSLTFELTHSDGEVVYRKEVDLNSSITLTDVAINSYYLSGSNEVLFTTTTAQNEVTCVFTEDIKETTCAVKDTTPVVQESTQETAETSESTETQN